MDTVLLVVDVQAGIMDERLYHFEAVKHNIKTLIAKAREKEIPVIYVRHDDGIGSGFSLGDADFEIDADLAPRKEERIFDKQVNSAFHPSVGLSTYLDSLGIRKVIVCGLQTDLCIDATIKSGFDHGYTMIVPSEANSTVDDPFMNKETVYHYFNAYIWPHRYAECMSAEDCISLMERK